MRESASASSGNCTSRGPAWCGPQAITTQENSCVSLRRNPPGTCAMRRTGTPSSIAPPRALTYSAAGSGKMRPRSVRAISRSLASRAPVRPSRRTLINTCAEAESIGGLSTATHTGAQMWVRPAKQRLVGGGPDPPHHPQRLAIGADQDVLAVVEIHAVYAHAPGAAAQAARGLENGDGNPALGERDGCGEA